VSDPFDSNGHVTVLYQCGQIKRSGISAKTINKTYKFRKTATNKTKLFTLCWRTKHFF